jgi:hypothetical protein
MNFEHPKSEVLIKKDFINELIDFRFNQSRNSRLIEYIIGINPDDPKIIERLIEDKKIIRSKYNLPAIEIRRDSPSEYEHLLNEIAKTNNVTIKDKSECGRFFEENNHTNAVYLEDSNSIGIRMNRNDIGEYSKSLGILEHELIHSEQEKFYKDMPIELKEYEAYLAANINLNELKKIPENIEPELGLCISSSVDSWYRHENKKRESKKLPLIEIKWDDPVYFLRNIDNVSDDKIEEYLNKKKINTLE